MSIKLVNKQKVSVLISLFLYMCLVAQSCPTRCNPMDCSQPGSSVPGDFPGKNTGVGCHALLQQMFPLQGFNPGLLYCRWILYCLSHQRSPWILEWAAYPFSRGSSLPRNWTVVSCIADKFFTSWAIRKPLYIYMYIYVYKYIYIIILMFTHLISMPFCTKCFIRREEIKWLGCTRRRRS